VEEPRFHDVLTPERSGNAGIRYQDPSGLYGVVEGHYWGSAPYSVSDSKNTPSVKTVDVRVGWRRSLPLGTAAIDLDISAGSKNVLDRENYLRRGTDSYVPGRPREFFGSVSATIHFQPAGIRAVFVRSPGGCYAPRRHFKGRSTW
jgi:outer membrane receptor protein involved in Fe transport